ASHEPHPQTSAARRARPQRSQHPARRPHRRAEPPAPRRRPAPMSAAAPVYLDYAATTPVDPRVAEAMASCLTPGGDFGNASSSHAFGRAAAARIGRARSQVAALIGASADEIVFTSGATESNNLAIKGAVEFHGRERAHVLTSKTEHRCVLDTCRWLETRGVR